MDAREKLEFAVRFAQDTDLGKLRQGDLLNIQDDIAAFLGLKRLTLLDAVRDINAETFFGLKEGATVFPRKLGSEDYWIVRDEDESVFSLPTRPPYPHELTREHLLALQEDTLEFFKTLTEERAIFQKEPFPSYSRKVGANINIIKEIPGFEIPLEKRAFWSDKDMNVFVHYGNIHNLFLAQLSELIRDYKEPKKFIRKCPQCGKIFYRVRKQQYCSSICTNKVLFQRYIDKHGDRAIKMSVKKTKHVSKKSKGGKKIGSKNQAR